mmetsp:Transcript_15368/g.36202  ORF Transcript_15368/g.36202 Transcript_15368/m.36202 type:complete len:209 (+) Transcript_15368:116-742(+)
MRGKASMCSGQLLQNHLLWVAEGTATDQRKQQQVPTTLNRCEVGALVRRSQCRACQAKKLLLCWPCAWRSPIDRGRDNLIDQGVRLLQHPHVNLGAPAPEDDLCISVDAHLDLLCNLPYLRRAQRLLVPGQRDFAIDTLPEVLRHGAQKLDLLLCSLPPLLRWLRRIMEGIMCSKQAGGRNAEGCSGSLSCIHTVVLHQASIVGQAAA